MAQWELTEKVIYKLLKHPYQDDKSLADKMTIAYQEFVEELFHFLNKENDNKLLIRKLNITYIEFVTLKAMEESSPTDNGHLKIVFLDKLMSLINMELELLYRQMEYPKYFINIEADWKSPFYLNQDIIKLVDIMEIVSGIFNIKNGVYRMDRKEIFFSDFTQCFEKIFNIEFGDIYKKEKAVLKRKPGNITEFLDRLKKALIQKSKDEGYSQT